MDLMKQTRNGLLMMASAVAVLSGGAGVTYADRVESRDIRSTSKPSRPAYNRSNDNGGFFNFLDFSRRTVRRGNGDFFGSDQPRRRVRATAGSSGSFKHYTYTPDRLVGLSAPGLHLPLPATSGSGDAMPAGAQGPVVYKLDDSLAQTVFDTLKSGATPVRVTKAQRKAITTLYQDRGFTALWTSMDGLEAKARALLTVLQKASEEGFDGDVYRLPVVAEQGSIDAVESDLAAMARFDIELTALALRYAANASGGMITPNRLSGYHDLKPPKLAAGTALRRLTQSERPDRYLMSLHPRHPAYAALRRALADATQKVEVADVQETIPDGPTLRPGTTDYRVGLVRARLITLGHLDAGDPQGQDASIEPTGQELPVAASSEAVVQDDYDEADNLYDQQMVGAVRAFQREAGLRPDALIGPATLRAFNGERQESFDKAERLRLNMERLRWLPRDFGRRHVFVNQASYKLQVVDNGRTVWRSKVIVGKPKNQTSFFSDEMETVVFNPYWGVPQSIIVNEMLPKLQNDPGYLDRQGYEVISSSGRKISSYNVDWWSYYDKVPVGVRQPPGRRNALGEVKFLFPNKHAIYLHDTPTKKLFERGQRAFSHGCVRVQNPRELAKAVLGWGDSKVAQTIATGRNTKVPLTSKFKVHLTYFTAWPGADGSVDYMRDVYGRDSRLISAVNATLASYN